MTPEEKAAADAAAAAKAAADAAHQGSPEYLREEAKKAFAARDAAKAESDRVAAENVRLKAIEDEHLKLKQASMSEQEKLQARVKQLEPLEAEVTKTREVFTKLLAVETAELAEEHKALIPSLPTTAEQLLWVRDAKAKGLFGAQVPPVGTRKPSHSGGNIIKRSEYNKLDLNAFDATRKKIQKGELVLVED